MQLACRMGETDDAFRKVGSARQLWRGGGGGGGGNAAHTASKADPGLCMSPGRILSTLSFSLA